MDRGAFVKVMLFPALILLGFIGYNYYTLNTGEEILLKTAPVDPRDIFRGDYVNLRYDISTITPSIISDGYFDYGDNIYAVLLKGDKFLFNWDEIPEYDNALIEFLKRNYNIDWVNTAKIEKIDDGRTIRILSEKNSLSLKLNDEKTRVNLIIDDGRTDEFIAKTENNKISIYDDKFWYVRNVMHYRPSLQDNEVCMKGEVTSKFENNLIVNWGIESYFVPEGKGKEIEKEIRNVSVKVSVDRTCRALIKELYINDKPVVFDQ